MEEGHHTPPGPASTKAAWNSGGLSWHRGQGAAHPATPLDRCVCSPAPHPLEAALPSPWPPLAVVKIQLLLSLPTKLPMSDSSPILPLLSLVQEPCCWWQKHCVQDGRCPGPPAARDPGTIWVHRRSPASWCGGHPSWANRPGSAGLNSEHRLGSQTQSNTGYPSPGRETDT